MGGWRVLFYGTWGCTCGSPLIEGMFVGGLACEGSESVRPKTMFFAAGLVATRLRAALVAERAGSALVTASCMEGIAQLQVVFPAGGEFSHKCCWSFAFPTCASFWLASVIPTTATVPASLAALALLVFSFGLPISPKSIVPATLLRVLSILLPAFVLALASVHVLLQKPAGQR